MLGASSASLMSFSTEQQFGGGGDSVGNFQSTPERIPGGRLNFEDRFFPSWLSVLCPPDEPRGDFLLSRVRWFCLLVQEQGRALNPGFPELCLPVSSARQKQVWVPAVVLRVGTQRIPPELRVTDREGAVLLHSREEHGRNLKQGRCNGEMWLLIKHLEFSASGATQNIHLDFLLMLSSKFQIH